MAIEVGTRAPDFKLFNTDKEPVSLSESRGKKNVLLLFFPMAFTGVCTAELCSVRDDIGKYDNEKTQVYGISVDSVFTLENFKAQQNYNYPLLSDFNKDASKEYGVLYESFTGMDMHGVSKRSAFIIDKNGDVQYAEVLENAGDIPNFSEIDKKLAELS